MKIDIDKDSLDFIKNLSHEILSQDNRMTATPYFYVIRDKVVQCVPEGCGSETRYALDHPEYLMTKEDTEAHILENYSDEITEEYSIEDKLSDMISEGSITEYDIDVQTITPENHNIFFTETACKKHLCANMHHFKSPSTYVRHAWRNPEIETLLNIVHELAKQEGSTNE
jgi:hypothetical protein